MIYLASPYSHPDPAVEHNRCDMACRAAAHFINRGYPVISPIAHSHVLHVTYGCGGDWATWAEIDRTLIAASDEVWVLTIDGWADSAGIEREVEFAEGMGIPVKCVDYIEPTKFMEIPDGQ